MPSDFKDEVLLEDVVALNDQEEGNVNGKMEEVIALNDEEEGDVDMHASGKLEDVMTLNKETNVMMHENGKLEDVVADGTENVKAADDKTGDVVRGNADGDCYL